MNARHAILIFVAASLTTVALAFSVPTLSGPVVDQAGMLSSATETQLDTELRRLWNAGGSQIAVLTVQDMDGLEIEQASIQVVEQWKLGTASKDNGILLMIAKQERSLRIEVGQGREGELPDAYARRIIDDIVVPRFKSGDVDGGVIAGVAAILKRTDPEFTFGMAPARASSSGRYAQKAPFGVFFFMMMLFVVFNSIFGSRRRRGFFGGGSHWGGGGGFGGGGGGGFSGGGGGFSGGGASGKW